VNDVPRQKLREIVKQYGQKAVDDARLCRALLLDFCGEYRREIFVLNSAQEELVANDLQEISNSVPLSVLVAQLTQRLVENRALDENAARWAVESWAFALDIDIDKLPPLKPVPPPPSRKSTAKSRRPAESPVVKNENAYMSQYTGDVYGRPESQPDAKWDKLGSTPGKVEIPPQHVLGLRPSGLTGETLAEWVREIQHPGDVVSLALSDRITDTGLFTLRKFPNLTYLEVKRAEALTNTGMSYLAHLPNLVTLNLSWCSHITDDGLAYLRALLSLTHLSITWGNITDSGLAHLRHLSRLSSLALRECKHINGNGLSHLRALSNLQTLDLYGCSQLDNAGLRYLGALAGLRKLDLSRCPKINRRGTVYLRTLTELSYLDLSWNSQIKDGELASLCDLPNLSTLNLSHTNITNKGLGHIGDIVNLIFLDLSWCEAITDSGLHPLRRLDKLAYLNISGCRRLTPRGIARLNRPGLYISH